MRIRCRASMQRKLALVAIGTSATALFVVGNAFLWLERRASYVAAESEATTLAEVIAFNAARTLDSQDRSGAAAILAALGAKADIQCGVLFDVRDRLFASYLAAGASTEQCEHALGSVEADVTTGVVSVTRRVEVAGERVGSFVLVQSLSQVRERVVHKALLTAAVTLSCALLAFLFASRFVSRVTRPILRLAELARAVTESQDYTQRTDVQGNDEVGVLADALNLMLARIEADTDLYAQRERLREINSMLEAEKQRALAAVRAKTEFLANMSHEIRTPMTAILGYVELLRGQEVEPGEMNRVLEVVQRNGHHLVAVINDILDISKLESGQLTLEAVDCPLIEMVRDVADLMAERATEKSLSFEVRYLTRVPRVMESDPTRLRQILLNMVSNAIKFTSSGCVRISLESRAALSDPNSHRLMIRVEDSGIGIAKEKHAVVFQPFAQADTSTARRFGGTGLGLAISATLAELLGGRLELQKSVVGEGSVFELELPIHAPASGLEWVEPERARERPRVAASAQRSYPEDLSGHVLLAEDSIDNQRLVRLFLRRAGLSLDVAENGRVACEMARAAREAGAPYDVILMDMQMPELDGYAATGQLRNEGHTEPIIAFTAHAMIGERERCLAAGCDDFVTKPIDRGGLLRTLASYLK